MANMSYCRFENTLSALQDCYEALNNFEAEDKDLNEYELRAKKRLLALCKSIAEDYDE